MAPRYYKGGGNAPTTYLLSTTREEKALGHVQVIEKEEEDELGLTEKAGHLQSKLPGLSLVGRLGCPGGF